MVRFQVSIDDSLVLCGAFLSGKQERLGDENISA
jgi:hypothetical protein